MIIIVINLNRSDKYYKEIGRIPPMTPEREKELRDSVVSSKISKIQGEKQLITHNLRFVISKAKHYFGKGISDEDLIQAGNLGLINAAHAYDWNKGCGFLAIANYYINKELLNALHQANIITLPEKTGRIFNKYEQYIQSNGIPWDNESFERCAVALGISHHKLDKLIKGDLSSPICRSLIDEENKDIDVADTAYDEDAICDHLDFSSFNAKLPEILTKREKSLIFLHFGFNGQKMTFEHIGKIYRKDKQWAHREVQKALDKLSTIPSVRAHIQSLNNG